MEQSVGDFVCFERESGRVIHEDMDAKSIHKGPSHQSCNNDIAVWAYAPSSVKREAKMLGVKHQYAVMTDLYSTENLFSISPWAGTY